MLFLKGKRIFIIEDNSGNLAIASIYLQQAGAVVKFSRWGEKATAEVQKAMPIDIILLDLMFPNNVSGFDIFAEIHAVPELEHIPIVAVSASDPDTAMPRASKMGFSGFIAKPISQRISYQVADVLAGKKVWVADSAF